MPINLIDKIKPKNGGSFSLVDAADVELPDGKRLDAVIEELDDRFPLEELSGTAVLKPEKYYVFGEVSELSVTLEEPEDGKVHEYYFEFSPTEDFGGLNISPEPKWVSAPQFVAGKTCQVSIVRGIGVLIRA